MVSDMEGFKEREAMSEEKAKERPKEERNVSGHT